MAVRFRIASIGAFLTLVAFVLLLLTVVSAPISTFSYLAKVGSNKFGVFGYCDSGTCSDVRLGYSTSALTRTNSGSTGSPFTLTKSSRRALSYVLVAHPVAAGLTLISLLLTIIAHVHGPSQSAPFFSVLIVSLCLSAAVTLLAFIIDMLMFVPASNAAWGTWVTLVALILELFAGLSLCIGRRRISMRKAMHRRIADDPEMSGAAYFSRKAEANAVADNAATLPQFADIEVAKTSSRSLSGNSDNDEQGLLPKKSMDQRSITSTHSATRLPLSEQRAMRQGAGAAVPAVPPIPPEHRSSPANDYAVPRYQAQQASMQAMSRRGPESWGSRGPQNTFRPEPRLPQIGSRPPEPRQQTPRLPNLGPQAPRQTGEAVGGLMVAAPASAPTMGPGNPHTPLPRSAPLTKNTPVHAPMERRAPAGPPLSGGPPGGMAGGGGPMAGGNRYISPRQQWAIRDTEDSFRDSRNMDEVPPRPPFAGSAAVPRYASNTETGPQRDTFGPSYRTPSQSSLDSALNFGLAQSSSSNSRLYRAGAGAGDSANSLNQMASAPHPGQPQSPTGSTSSNFTSVSQRGINPRWQPSPGAEYMMASQPAAVPRARKQKTEHMSALLSNNPDFELPSMPAASFGGRGRGRGRGAGYRAGPSSRHHAAGMDQMDFDTGVDRAGRYPM